jgi:hypothetical protein
MSDRGSASAETVIPLTPKLQEKRPGARQRLAERRSLEAGPRTRGLE